MLEIGNIGVRFLNFEIEKDFLQKTASFKDLKHELVGFSQLHSRKQCSGPLKQQMERPRGIKKPPDLSKERKEGCQEQKVSGRGTG